MMKIKELSDPRFSGNPEYIKTCQVEVIGLSGGEKSYIYFHKFDNGDEENNTFWNTEIRTQGYEQETRMYFSTIGPKWFFELASVIAKNGLLQ
jgi:hypothetical protein